MVRSKSDISPMQDECETNIELAQASIKYIRLILTQDKIKMGPV